MIKLNESYSIEPDTHGWRLVYSEERTPKNGKPYIFQGNWHYVSIEQALKKFFDLNLKDSDSVSSLIRDIKSTHEMVEKLAPKIYVVNGKLVQK